MTKRIHDTPLTGTIHVHLNRQSHFRRTALYWPWSMAVCAKSFRASFCHPSESVYIVQSIKKHRRRCVMKSCQKISAPRKSPGGWFFTISPKVRHVAPSFHLPSEYEVRSLYIWNIHSNCTRNNGSFMSHNDLDLQTGDMKLYMYLTVLL